MPTGPAEPAAIKQRITTLNQLFTHKETRVLATKCTRHESVPKDILNDMDEKAVEIIELMGQLGTELSLIEKLDKKLTQRQIRCEFWVNNLPILLPSATAPSLSSSCSRQFNE